MFHHDSRSYVVASGEAAKFGREKFEKIVEAGRASAEAVVHQVQSQVPLDRLVKASALSIKPFGSDGYALQIPGELPVRLHNHALGQIADKTGVPHRYLQWLTDQGRDKKGNRQSEWGRELATENINRLLFHANGHRNLIRQVTAENGPEIRGVLSDSFRRLDSRPLLDAFIGACQRIGAVPVEGFALDTKVRMRAVLPYVFEPVPNEPMLFGIQWGNSDFGAGGHTLGLFNTRVTCTNLATMDEVLRQIHLGRKLTDDDMVYSEQTLSLDLKTNVSALGDVVENYLSPDRVNGYMESIRQAVAEKVDERDVTRILKAKLGKDEMSKVLDHYAGNDVINLPPGNNTYRLSNAVSWFAQDRNVSRNRQLELQRIAGEILPPFVTAKETVEV